jgi:hypothetical protein
MRLDELGFVDRACCAVSFGGAAGGCRLAEVVMGFDGGGCDAFSFFPRLKSDLKARFKDSISTNLLCLCGTLAIDSTLHSYAVYRDEL